MLAAASAMADPLDAPLNGVPLFSSIAGKTKYETAANKAQEAFFLQTGVTQKVSVVTNAATKVASDKAATTIDNNTPLSSRQVFFAAGFSYAVLVRKQVVERFKDPLFSNVTHIVTVGKGKSEFTVNLPF